MSNLRRASGIRGSKGRVYSSGWTWASSLPTSRPDREGSPPAASVILSGLEQCLVARDSSVQTEAVGVFLVQLLFENEDAPAPGIDHLDCTVFYIRNKFRLTDNMNFLGATVLHEMTHHNLLGFASFGGESAPRNKDGSFITDWAGGAYNARQLRKEHPTLCVEPTLIRMPTAR